MNWDHVTGAVTSVALLVLLGIFFMSASDSATEKDCLNAGRTVINNTVYACQKIGPRIKP